MPTYKTDQPGSRTCLSCKYGVVTYVDKFPALPILQLIFLTANAASMLQNNRQII